MSQSELAARLNVSRQSVAKWEAEKSFPEMGKLIAICEIFGCTMDGLLRGNLSEPSCPEPKGEKTQNDKPPKAPANLLEWAAYDAYITRRARLLAFAAFLIVGGVSFEFLIEAIQLDLRGEVGSLGPLSLLVCLGAGIALALFARSERKSFQRTHPAIQRPTGKESTSIGGRRKALIASLALVAAVVLAPGVVPGLDGKSAYASAVYWLAAAVVLSLSVNSWIRLRVVKGESPYLSVEHVDGERGEEATW